MYRRQLIALALFGVSLPAPAQADVHPGLQPVGGFASTSLRVNAHTDYLVGFMVVREVTPKTRRLELISSADLCDTDRESCDEVAEQTDPLPMGAFVVAANGRTATLRTRWAGSSLVIRWSSRGLLSSGHVLVVDSADGFHQQVWADGYTKWNDITFTQLFGRTCRDADGILYASKAGAASDYSSSGHTGMPRSESLRAKLAATQGRCFTTQT
jgi:hypothetical protein